VSDSSELKLVIDCLDNGKMAWKIWAEHWRQNPAYGNGQPEIHETHAKIIADFERAIDAAKRLAEQSPQMEAAQ
jgi:hypothetical protein